MMKFVCLFVSLISVTSVASDTGQGVPWLVELNQGAVRGYKAAENKYYGFYGIPYATAPTGPYKFKAPLPAPKWTGIYEATTRNVICPQGPMIKDMTKDKVHFMNSEDCLNINVYVPDNDELSLPVVVYVHGGGFQVGFGEFVSHTPLVNTGKVIVVNFNYRVGAHGFLCLGTEDIPGNAGMKDQIAALRWVRDNIAKFRGNPHDVTLAGYSAGSVSVDLLMLSKSARGLFHKVIPESGSSLNVWSVQSDPVETAKQVALSLNFTNVDNIAALEHFYKTTSLDILLSNMFLDLKDSTFGFVPCIEAPTSEESFLDDTPLNILKNGDFNKIPVLAGFAKDEGMLRLTYFDGWKNELNEHFEDFLPVDLKFKNTEEKIEIANKVRKFYFGDRVINDDNVSGYVDYVSDIMFAYGTVKAVKLILEASWDSVYLYEYSYYDDLLPGVHGYKGASHCAQSFALVEDNEIMAAVIPPSESKEYEKVKKSLVEMWINFINTGKPVPENSSSLKDWPHTTLEKFAYMDLNVELNLKYDLLKDRVQFWDNIYNKYYKQPIPPRTQITQTKTEL